MIEKHGTVIMWIDWLQSECCHGYSTCSWISVSADISYWSVLHRTQYIWHGCQGNNNTWWVFIRIKDTRCTTVKSQWPLMLRMFPWEPPRPHPTLGYQLDLVECFLTLCVYMCVGWSKAYQQQYKPLTLCLPCGSFVTFSACVFSILVNNCMIQMMWD